MAARTTLILGGARSGKSRRAQTLVEAVGPHRVFVATAEPFDAEMRDRIARHREERGEGWRTVEAPLELPAALEAIALEGVAPPLGAGRDPGPSADRGAQAGESTASTEGANALLVDCLTLWLSNLMMGERDVEAASERLLGVLAALPLPVVLVSNEVGSGLVPETPLGRRFRDEQGRLNRRVADVCERVELVVAGQPLTIRGEAVR